MWTTIMEWFFQSTFLWVLALSLWSPVPFWKHAIFLLFLTLRTYLIGSVGRFTVSDKSFSWGVLENKYIGQIFLPINAFPEPAISQINSVLTPDKYQDLTNQVLS